MNKAGSEAEQRAASYLQARGLRLLTRNYHCRFGEIDLIMREGETLVFVEVRLRANSDYGGAGASINAAKQQKLLRSAEHYLQQQDDMPCRFDAVLLDKTGNIDWIRDAFGA